MGYRAARGFVLGALTHRPVAGAIMGGVIGGLIGAMGGSHPKVHDVVLNPWHGDGDRADPASGVQGRGRLRVSRQVPPLREDQTGSGSGPGGYLAPDNTPPSGR